MLNVFHHSEEQAHCGRNSSKIIQRLKNTIPSKDHNILKETANALEEAALKKKKSNSLPNLETDQARELNLWIMSCKIF